MYSMTMKLIILHSIFIHSSDHSFYSLSDDDKSMTENYSFSIAFIYPNNVNQKNIQLFNLFIHPIHCPDEEH